MVSHVYSVLLARRKYSFREAEAWIKRHGFKKGKVFITDRYFHFRQRKTKRGIKYHNKSPKSGIVLTIGFENSFTRSPYRRRRSRKSRKTTRKSRKSRKSRRRA